MTDQRDPGDETTDLTPHQGHGRTTLRPGLVPDPAGARLPRPAIALPPTPQAGHLPRQLLAGVLGPLTAADRAELRRLARDATPDGSPFVEMTASEYELYVAARNALLPLLDLADRAAAAEAECDGLARQLMNCDTQLVATSEDLMIAIAERDAAVERGEAWYRAADQMRIECDRALASALIAGLHQEENAQLRDELAKADHQAVAAGAREAGLRAALEQVEFVYGREDDADSLYCPWCNADGANSYGFGGVHVPTCPRQLALVGSPQSALAAEVLAKAREWREHLTRNDTLALAVAEHRLAMALIALDAVQPKQE